MRYPVFVCSCRWSIVLCQMQLAKERLLKESNALAERVAKAHRDMEEQIAANTALLTQTSHKRLELVAKQDEITRLQARPLWVSADTSCTLESRQQRAQ